MTAANIIPLTAIAIFSLLILQKKPKNASDFLLLGINLSLALVIYSEYAVFNDGLRGWEDRLMDGRDAGFSTWFEFGARVFVPLKHDNIDLGAGVHYMIAPNWETYTDPSGELYNNRIRVALVLAFESNK